MPTTSARKLNNYIGRTNKPAVRGFLRGVNMYTVTYSNDYGHTQNTEEINAKTYTEAYLIFICNHDLKDIIMKITEDLRA